MCLYNGYLCVCFVNTVFMCVVDIQVCVWDGSCVCVCVVVDAMCTCVEELHVGVYDV